MTMTTTMAAGADKLSTTSSISSSSHHHQRHTSRHHHHHHHTHHHSDSGPHDHLHLQQPSQHRRQLHHRQPQQQRRQPQPVRHRSSYSFWTIVIIACNTMNGPGLTTLPTVGYAAGNVVYCTLVIVAAITTSFVVQQLCHLMWKSTKQEHDDEDSENDNFDNKGIVDNDDDDDDVYNDFFEDDNDYNDDDDEDDDNNNNINREMQPLHRKTTQHRSRPPTNRNITDDHHHHHRRPKLEESDIVALCDRLLHGQKTTLAAAIIMIGCSLSLALAQMMLCAAIADSMIITTTGQSCAYSITTFQSYCTSNASSMKPFLLIVDETTTTATSVPPVSLLSMGLILSSSITISLTAVDLDSMLTAQYVLFGCLLVACGRFCYTLHNTISSSSSLSSAVEATTFDESSSSLSTSSSLWTILGPQPLDAIGPVLFNFAFVVTVPPLSCGATSPSNVTRASTVACTIMATIYIFIGWIGSTAIIASMKAAAGGGDDQSSTTTTTTTSNDDEDNNLLSLVLRGNNDNNNPNPNPFDSLAVVLFGLSQLAAIPVYCELARETFISHLHLTTDHHNRIAFVLSHVLPWIIVALTYNSTLFETFVEWSSLLLLGFSNFSLPLLLHHKHTVLDDELHHRFTGTENGGKTKTIRLDRVVWGLILITSSIVAVIVQRITNSTILAELAFIGSCTWVYYKLQNQQPTTSQGGRTKQPQSSRTHHHEFDDGHRQHPTISPRPKRDLLSQSSAATGGIQLTSYNIQNLED